MSITEQREDGWWVIGVAGTEPCGPYDTQAQAESDRRGMERFSKYQNHLGYVTTDPITGKKKEYD